jgi:poly(3-hydroxyalkanoate) synthetase
VVQRHLDALATLGDPRAQALRRRVTRWLLDEFPIPARLYRDAVRQLLREDRFARGTLRIDRKLVSPTSIAAPVLVIADPQSRLAPLSASQPVLAAGGRRRKVLRYDAEPGIGCRHVGALVGPAAQTEIWPKVAAWLAEL